MSKIKPVKLKDILLELVKKKEMILQRDAQLELNKYILTASKKLDEEGKIKRYKIKVRQPMGNLNDLWLLCVPNIDYNKVIDYEKKMVNKPYNSPLEEHHFYKKGENPKNKFKDHETGEITVIDKKMSGNGNDENVIDMSEYVRINNSELEIKEYNGQRVVSFKDIDKMHDRVKGTANRNFKANKDKFIVNEDYFIVKPKDIQKDEIRLSEINNRGTIFITETGYLMLVKSFTDDLSWTVQRELVKTYFKVKQLQKDPEVSHLPQVQNASQIDILEVMVSEMRNQNSRIENLENKINSLSKVLSN